MDFMMKNLFMCFFSSEIASWCNDLEDLIARFSSGGSVAPSVCQQPRENFFYSPLAPSVSHFK
jgi:hypothetical protein